MIIAYFVLIVTVQCGSWVAAHTMKGRRRKWASFASIFDGVLANFTRGFTKIGHRLFGTPIGDSTCQQTWNFDEFPLLKLDKEKSAFDGPIWTAVKKSPDFWATLDPLNVSVMHRINRIPNKIFITNRPGINTAEQTAFFLTEWGIENPRVVVAKDKGPIAVQENVIAVIDDLYSNLVDIHNAVPTCYTAMLWCAYNMVHHDEWLNHYCGEVVISVDQFIDVCIQRGLVEEPVEEDIDSRIHELVDFGTINYKRG